MRKAASAFLRVAEAAARRYAAAGRFATRYALGKLRHDPVFAVVLAQGLIPDRARLVDLGCGQGLLFALLVAARDAFEKGMWPEGWPPPPRPREMVGFDVSTRSVALARTALAAHASIAQADLRSVALPMCDAIAIIDVLHYVGLADQEAALAKCAAALDTGGVLLVRVNDAGAGWRHALTSIADQFATLVRTGVWPRLQCRRLPDWTALLERLGFEVRSQPASAGTPFANALLVARRR